MEEILDTKGEDVVKEEDAFVGSCGYMARLLFFRGGRDDSTGDYLVVGVGSRGMYPMIMLEYHTNLSEVSVYLF